MVKPSNETLVSVVIGYKDWGLDRLESAVYSIIQAMNDIPGEVIVSDFGSTQSQGLKSSVESWGAVYLRTETPTERWSRAEALNAGFAIARGSVLISTDADMIFSPRSVSKVAQLINSDPSLSVALQCRDLPSTLPLIHANEAIPWSTLERVSRLRPRWGVGGMMATSRASYLAVRGLDERMHTYGGEDLDFEQRLRRSGSRLHWIDDDLVRMYHQWHPPADRSKGSTVSAAVEQNRSILSTDPTVIRNVASWNSRPFDITLLVSVVIATRNRSRYLRDSIASVLCQTVIDFELIIIDDGSTDDTKVVVESFHDTRIKYIRQEHLGIAKARNHGADVAKGTYTVVHDDDDIMLPDRIENHFNALTAGSSGSYGAFVNFSDSDGEMTLIPTKLFNMRTASVSGGAPGHTTWMLRTDIIRKLRYDETCRSGSDNNLALRMIVSGYRFDHTRRLMTLRRMHQGQVSDTDRLVQNTSAKLSFRMLHFNGLGKPAETIHKSDQIMIIDEGDFRQAALNYLPDHLVDRSIYADWSDHISKQLPDRSRLEGNLVTIHTAIGDVLSKIVILDNASLVEMAMLTKANVRYRVETKLKTTRLPSESRHSEEPFLSILMDSFGGKVSGTFILAEGVGPEVPPILTESLGKDDVHYAKYRDKWILITPRISTKKPLDKYSNTPDNVSYTIFTDQTIDNSEDLLRMFGNTEGEL